MSVSFANRCSRRTCGIVRVHVGGSSPLLDGYSGDDDGQKRITVAGVYGNTVPDLHVLEDSYEEMQQNDPYGWADSRFSMLLVTGVLLHQTV